MEKAKTQSKQDCERTSWERAHPPHRILPLPGVCTRTDVHPEREGVDAVRGWRIHEKGPERWGRIGAHTAKPHLGRNTARTHPTVLSWWGLFVSSLMPISLINSRWSTSLKISLKMF